ncbi:hypothetical protein [Enterobacter mori]|uniref:hypothetical protein n=1 Tax=Enterobacter mori TaxID=539813 RepID=UPI003B83EAB7
MKPEYLSETALMLCDSVGPNVKPERPLAAYERRELERIIASRAANRERFIQKVRAPAWEWKKPAPRR